MDNRTLHLANVLSLLITLFFCNSGFCSEPYLYELEDTRPESLGQRIKIIGGYAVSGQLENANIKSDHLLVTRINGNSQLAWFRENTPTNRQNTQHNPIEFDWYPFSQNDDIAPILIKLRENWGKSLYWRPPSKDVTMSFIDWGSMEVLVMAPPLKDITITNVPESDLSHDPRIESSTRTNAKHRMWYFPVPPKRLQIGAINSEHRVTFTDASFNSESPWLWSTGSKTEFQSGSCDNPLFDPDIKDSSLAASFKKIRWFTKSGLITIDTPKPLKLHDSHDFTVEIHSDFAHTWGNAIFIQSTPLLTPDRDPFRKHWSGTMAGNELLDISISGKFYDAGIELRAHGPNNPAQDLLLNDVTISDPFSLGTAFSGTGQPTSTIDGDCSNISSPALRLGPWSKARGSVTFEHGAAALFGYMIKGLSGVNENEPFRVTYKNIGFSDTVPQLRTWSASKCCIPKIDGFSDKSDRPVNISVTVENKFKSGRLHTPLAIEWGADDVQGVGLFKESFFEMKNAILHFMPAPPLIPPTHMPTTPKMRVNIKSNHGPVPVKGNPWAIFYSNMTLLDGSVFANGITLLGARDEKVPKTVSSSNFGQAFIAEDFTIKNNSNISQRITGDAPPKVRLGLNNWAPPAYIWFRGNIIFEEVVANGEIVFHPAWGDHKWVLRIDQPLQPGVRIKLGKAQSYSGRYIENATWHKGQIAQQKPAHGQSNRYFKALRDHIPPSSSVANKKLWLEIPNPFDSMTLIYLGKEYNLPKQGAVIGEAGELILPN